MSRERQYGDLVRQSLIGGHHRILMFVACKPKQAGFSKPSSTWMVIECDSEYSHYEPGYLGTWATSEGDPIE